MLIHMKYNEKKESKSGIKIQKKKKNRKKNALKN